MLAVICIVSTALPVHAAKIESINAKDYGPLMYYVNGVTLGTPTGGAIGTYAHYDTNTNNAVYCANVDKEFQNAVHTVGGTWNNPSMYAAFSFLFDKGAKKKDGKNASGYSTGESDRDWYATQMVVWELLHHYGIKDASGGDAGLDINSTSAVSGYSDVYNVMKKLYNDALDYASAHKDDYAEPTLSFAKSGPIEVGTSSSDGSYVQSEWISIKSTGNMTSRSYSLSGAPSGATIVYEDSSNPKSRVAVRLPVSKVPPTGKKSFTLQIEATYTRPLITYLVPNTANAQELIVVGNTTTVSKSASIGLYTNPILGGVKVNKMDSETKTAEAQGDAEIGNAEYEIINKSGYDAWVKGKTYADGAVVMKLTADENGYAETGKQDMQAGTYLIRENKPPKGYLKQGTIERTFTINALNRDTLVDLTTASKAILNDVIRGGVKIKKQDSDYKDDDSQGDATLKEAAFAVFTNSKNPIMVGGKCYSAGETVLTLKTNGKGEAASAADALPYGTYEIHEVDPSEGYLINPEWKKDFTIREDEEIVDFTSEPCDEDVIRGGVRIEKRDLELDKAEALGGASLAGIEFTVTNKSAQRVWVNDESYEPEDEVLTIVTDENGCAQTEEDTLPYGTYSIRETKTNDSYLLTDGEERTFEIRNDKEIVTATTDGEEMIFRNQVVRNDFHFNKIADGTGARMGKIAFAVTMLKTGEQHVIVTNKNGVYNSKSKTNPHSQNTNGNDGVLEKYSGEDDIIPSDELDYKAGLWFGLGQQGSEAAVQDGLGALPDGEYRLQELRCESNIGYKLLDVKFYVEDDQTVEPIIDLGTLTDDEDEKPEIHTSAVADDTGTHETQVGKETKLTDTVSYTNLTPGKEYTMRGTLMIVPEGSKEAQELLINGEPVKAEKKFTPKEKDGTVKMTFTFDSSAIAGTKTVVFEEVRKGNLVVAAHADAEDEGQQVNFIDIKTSAVDKESGTHEAKVSKETVFVDTVSYTGLTPGKAYVMKGVLMDAKTGKKLLVKGKEVTAEKKFTPKKADGTVDIEFTLDTSALAGKETVVFEDLYRDNVKIATHADLKDKDQTIKINKPEEPSTPDTPKTSTPSKTGTPTGTSQMSAPVKTGDSSRMIRHLLVLLMAGFTAAMAAIYRKRG